MPCKTSSEREDELMVPNGQRVPAFEGVEMRRSEDRAG